MSTEKNTPAPKHRTAIQRVARLLLRTVLFLLLFTIALFLLLLTPPVQRFATNKIEQYLGKKLQTKVEIGSIRIGLPRRVVLENVYIEDRTRDTLVSGGRIKANIELFKLLSNEVAINDLQLEGITAKIKRVLPDTTFNFQFIVDAFATDQTKKPDTAATPVMKLAVRNVGLTNCRILYKDVLTGNDLDANVRSMNARIDLLDPYGMRFDIPSVTLSGLHLRYYQTRPLTAPPVNADSAPAAFLPYLNIGDVQLRDIHVDYGNDVSAFYTRLDLGNLQIKGREIDLNRNRLHLARLRLDNNSVSIRLGRKAAAREVAEVVKAEASAAVQLGWLVRVDELDISGNHIRFDNDNQPRQPAGIDYAHFEGRDIRLYARNVLLNKDSMAAQIAAASFQEKSGFRLNELRADLLYAHNQAYIKDLYLRTPGTELKRHAVLQYASQEALVKNFERTLLDVNIVDSRIQVRDILAFAPQLRTNPAFANPAAVWHLNLRGNGTPNRLNIAAFQFNGLKNTRIDASGTLAGLTNPEAAGGTFTIHDLHTSQGDIALLTGQRLDNAQMDLPENFRLSGTLSGNLSHTAAHLAMATEYGNVGIKGTFSNLTNPAAARYDATISTRGLRLDRILRNQAPVASLSTNLKISGSGLSPQTINARFSGSIPSVVYNRYNYKNLRVNGRLNRNTFRATTDIRDPNADLTLTASGSFGNQTTLRVKGFVDSIKTLPLGFTAQPLVFRGRIDADVANMDDENLDARVLITEGLFVSGKDRAPIDSLSFVSGQEGTEKYMRVRSNFMNADLQGRYRFSDLGFILQNNIQPYFGVGGSYRTRAVQPYDIRFRVDAVNSPVFNAFVPGLNISRPVHAEGSLASGRGLEAKVDAPELSLNGNTIAGLSLKVHTTSAGLEVQGNIGHLVSGTMDIYNTRLRANILNNIIDFNLGVNDKGNKPKYRLAGQLRQPAAGSFALSLRSDSLLLNYEPWTIAGNNQLLLTPNAIGATNFVLSHDNQTLAIRSQAGTGSPLNVTFTNFQIGTITGFLQQDTMLADGVLNGNASFRNLPGNPLFTSDLTISNLSFRKDTIGNVALRVNNSSGERYVADAAITGFGNDIRLNGSMTPQQGTIGLNLDLNIRSLQLRSLKGALSGVLTQADGSMNGTVSIRGSSAAPKVNGGLNFDRVTVSTVAIGGPLLINDEQVRITENGFRFDNFTVRDSTNNMLTLNGDVATTNFVNYNFDLDVQGENFRVLNTERRVNSLYFGDLVISTKLHVGGNETNPRVDGNISVNKGTAFTIIVPQRDPGLVSREGIVEFVDFSNPGVDSFFLNLDTLNQSGITGMDIALNIDINKEASFNVIVDVANGDLLNLRGSGNLTAGVDPSGKITLTGSYVIDQGSYQFALNFLRRRFVLDPGSRITWLGEPTNAQLEVTGRYVANTAPLDLVEQQIAETAQRNYYLQRLPFQILLYLRGELLKPELTFDIQLPTDRSYNVAGDVISTVNVRLAQLRQEPSELNKQVFAVLLLNRFVGDNPFASNGGGFNAGSFARTSVSKLLTEQLNDLAAGLIAGVDINFDVTSSDDYTTGERRARTDLNVGLSKQLLNDRLTVTVGSNFQLEGPQQGNQQSNNIAGNVQVNYQLSRDGRYMLRFYRRNEYEGLVDGYVIETGLGFILSVDYNRFRELLQGRRVRRELRRQQKGAEKEQQPKEQATESAKESEQ